jgi:TRAP-type C4-dicarboxylate transport system permease small subunit
VNTETGASSLRSVLNGLIAALEWFSSATIMIMMLLTFVDVIGRYVFSQPIFGASEMISALLAATIFAGLGITNARDEHIVVELVDHQVRLISPRVYDVIIQLFSVGAMALVAFVMAEAALESYHQNARTFVLEIPTFYITSVVSTLAAISVISQVMGVYLILTGQRGYQKQAT